MLMLVLMLMLVGLVIKSLLATWVFTEPLLIPFEVELSVFVKSGDGLSQRHFFVCSGVVPGLGGDRVRRTPGGDPILVTGQR